MTSDLLVLATSIGIGAGLVLTAAMSLRLARLARAAGERATTEPARSPVTTAVALVASIALTGTCIAVAAALLVRAPMEPPTTPEPPTTRRPPVHARMADAAAGRRPTSDGSRLGDAQEILWPLVRLRVRVPRDWIVRTMSPTELDVRHPTATATFLIAQVSPMPAGPTFEEYVEAHVAHAREQLAAGAIDGWATKQIDDVPGVLTLEHRERGSLVTWTGFQPAAVGSLSVTLLAGAATDDFARDESLLGAIVDSARFD